MTTSKITRTALATVAAALTLAILPGTAFATGSIQHGLAAKVVNAKATAVRPTIRFVGDSITEQAGPALISYFGREGYGVTVNAVPGSTTAQDAHFVGADAKAAPTVEVINLGTNDTRYVAAGTTTLEAVHHNLDVFASHALFPRTCVVFVTVTSIVTTLSPAYADSINDWERTHFAHVADWDAAYNPAYFDAVDGPHPTELGRHALVHVIDNAVKTCAL